MPCQRKQAAQAGRYQSKRIVHSAHVLCKGDTTEFLAGVQVTIPCSRWPPLCCAAGHLGMRQQHYQGYTARIACMRVVGRQTDTLIPLDSFALRCRASVYAPAPPLAQSSDGSASRNHGSRCFTCKRKHSLSVYGTNSLVCFAQMVLMHPEVDA